MRFNPETDSLLLPPGEYEFEVIAASERVSSNGNDMLVLKLQIGDRHDGRTVTDYVLAKNTAKLLSAAKSCDLVDLFRAGEILPQHFVGKPGRASVGIEKSKKAEWPDKNIVLRYLPQIKR